MGRWPLGAQTRRRIGFSPMRCSSVAQTSIGLSGCWARASATACSSFFKRLPLFRRGRGRVARAGLLHHAFAETYGIKYDKAVACLVKDRDALLAFYDVPAEHWKHLRTTNPIESSR